jgi:hypothetical protein
MKPHARRHRGFEDERGVVYLVPRPTPRWRRPPFWRTRWGEFALLAAGAVAAGTLAIYLLWEAGVIGGGL